VCWKPKAAPAKFVATGRSLKSLESARPRQGRARRGRQVLLVVGKPEDDQNEIRSAQERTVERTRPRARPRPVKRWRISSFPVLRSRLSLVRILLNFIPKESESLGNREGGKSLMVPMGELLRHGGCSPASGKLGRTLRSPCSAQENLSLRAPSSRDKPKIREAAAIAPLRLRKRFRESFVALRGR